ARARSSLPAFRGGSRGALGRAAAVRGAVGSQPSATEVLHDLVGKQAAQAARARRPGALGNLERAPELAAGGAHVALAQIQVAEIKPGQRKIAIEAYGSHVLAFGAGRV